MYIDCAHVLLLLLSFIIFALHFQLDTFVTHIYMMIDGYYFASKPDWTAMSEPDPATFASVEQERDYWKEQAAKYQQRYISGVVFLFKLKFDLQRT